MPWLNRKKGEATTTAVGFVLIGLVLAAIVSVSFLQKTMDDMRGTTLEKNYLARDIALTLDAVYAAPGDIEYTYSMRNYRFLVEITKSEVLVKAQGESDAVTGRYEYFGGAGNSLKGAFSPLPNSNLPMLIIITKKTVDHKAVVSVRAENAE